MMSRAVHTALESRTLQKMHTASQSRWKLTTGIYVRDREIRRCQAPARPTTRDKVNNGLDLVCKINEKSSTV